MIYRRLTAILVLLLSLALSVDGAQKKSFTLCIDAGHGGGDPGAKGKISIAASSTAAISVISVPPFTV